MSYTPHTQEEISQMLATIGKHSVEDLFASIPKNDRPTSKLAIPNGMTEQDLWAHMLGLAMKNRTLSCSHSFLGAGAYRHYVPAAVSELASRSEFVTPYTPYQPEISQGTLNVLFEYQTMIARLFDMDVSNASHYSGATALADAALMARRIGKGRDTVIAFDSLHPEYRDVLRTILDGGKYLRTIRTKNGLIDRAALKEALKNNVAAVVVQFPNFFGIVEDLSDIAKLTHDAGALLISVTPEPVALGILTPPGAWGADIAVGEGLSLGLSTTFGGPSLGIFTTKKELVRQMPGRVCGRTTDADGKTGYVLTLSTREQHIRREKATSNICSNQALCATTVAIHLSMLGKEGLKELSLINAAKANYAKNALVKAGATLPFAAAVFNEFVIECKKPAKDILAILAKNGVLGGVDLGKWYPEMKNMILVCATELNTKEDIDIFAEELKKIL